MSNKNPKKTHRIPFYRRPPVIVGVFVILTVVVLVTILALSHFLQNQPTSEPSQPSSSATGSSQTESNTNADEYPQPATQPERPAQFEGDNPNQLAELTGSFALNTHNSDTLTIAVSIDQYLTKSGICQLELSQNGHTIRTAELPALADVTTSGCGPFSISIADLPSGTYNLKVTISADNKIGYVVGEVKL